jgi:hypothetical protein
MQSRDILAILIESTELFTKTIFEARHRTPEEIERFGEPRHYWRARLEPRARYDTKYGQWTLDTTEVDERVIRNVAVQALFATRRSFNGADIALALDVLKATIDPQFRTATKTEMAETVQPVASDVPRTMKEGHQMRMAIQ